MLRIRDVHIVSERAPSEWRGIDQHGTRVRLCFDKGAVLIVHGNTRCDVVCYRRVAPEDADSITYEQLCAALNGIVDLPLVGEGLG